MYHSYTQEQLRAYCRNCIEAMEIWARRLIDEKMTAEYGSSYIFQKVSPENYLVKDKIRKHVKK